MKALDIFAYALAFFKEQALKVCFSIILIIIINSLFKPVCLYYFYMYIYIYIFFNVIYSCNCKAEFEQAFAQCLPSHDPSEISLAC